MGIRVFALEYRKGGIRARVGELRLLGGWLRAGALSARCFVHFGKGLIGRRRGLVVLLLLLMPVGCVHVLLLLYPLLELSGGNKSLITRVPPWARTRRHSLLHTEDMFCTEGINQQRKDRGNERERGEQLDGYGHGRERVLQSRA